MMSKGQLLVFEASTLSDLLVSHVGVRDFNRHALTSTCV